MNGDFFGSFVELFSCWLWLLEIDLIPVDFITFGFFICGGEDLDRSTILLLVFFFVDGFLRRKLPSLVYFLLLFLSSATTRSASDGLFGYTEGEICISVSSLSGSR